MRPTVLIVDDSPSTAHLARLALSGVRCEVEVAPSAECALAYLHDWLRPNLMVIDANLPGVQASSFLQDVRTAVPWAPVVLLLDRGMVVPQLLSVSAQLFKPLQPRRLRSVVSQLIVPRGEDAAADA
ncbi:MAG: response regulator [Armatimonadetes bacterium]|nr:response regulator [Armatimonadota bacterium]